MEIRVRERWSRQKILQQGFVSTNLEKDAILFTDLMMAIQDYYTCNAGVSEKSVQFFNYIRLTIRNINDHFSTKRLHVGQQIAANIKKHNHGTLVISLQYGIIRAIMIHRTNSGALFPFFVLDWFQDSYIRGIAKHNESNARYIFSEFYYAVF